MLLNNSTLVSLFDNCAKKTPKAIAVVSNETLYTYQQLDEMSNRTARFLLKIGVTEGSIVGVLMDSSIELVVALLAIQKAGAAYLPFDTNIPVERFKYVIKDADVGVILTQAKFDEKHISIDDLFVFRLDEEQAYLEHLSSAGMDIAASASSAAYVIYTSGSTGKPKGCVIDHAAIVNRLQWMQSTYSLKNTDKVLQKTPYTFDVSVWEFFWPLITGAQLILAKVDGQKDSRYLINLINKTHVTVCHFVPSMLRVFLSSCNSSDCMSLRHVFSSGETLSFDLMEKALKILSGELHNLYGPTEAAIDVTHWSCHIRDDKKVPIGWPIDNVRIHVLDDELCPVDEGAEGELCIAGVALARGYLNRPELTDERFVDGPKNVDEIRIYRSGDKVKRLSDGAIEYIGRFDTQVKIRGFRIELGEIEAVLNLHEKVFDAAIKVQDENTPDPKLVAYVDTRNSPLSIKEINTYLALQLPEYMLPNYLCVLSPLPIGVHGKMDRGALPWPLDAVKSTSQKTENSSASKNSNTEVIPSSEYSIDELIAETTEDMCRLLSIASVDPERNLYELGATSLTLVSFADILYQKYSFEMPIDVILSNPSIANITRSLISALSTNTSISNNTSNSENRNDMSFTVDQKSLANDIAIMGVGVRFPGSNSLDEFWQQLVESKTHFKKFPKIRYAQCGASTDFSSFVYGNYFEEVDTFDNLLFNITPLDARRMDPQQRWLLEVSWMCFEDAGYRSDSLCSQLGKVGVFVGAMWEDYQQLDVDYFRENGQLLGSSNNALPLSSRLSYFYNCQGPSLTVNNTCSSSLTALHLAGHSLEKNESDVALVASANIISHSYHAAFLSQNGLVSDGNTVLPFGSSVDGTLIGEGVVAILLKPLDRAIKDHDHVYGVIKGSSLGHSGRTPRFTAPNVENQIKRMSELLAQAKLSPGEVNYVEAAASGASLADAAEYSAIKTVFGSAGQNTCSIGTVKDYVGHLESVSFMSQLLKVLLHIRHRELLPCLNTTDLGVFVQQDRDSNIRFVEQRMAWQPKAENGPLRAVINAYSAAGFGGNVLIESYKSLPVYNEVKRTDDDWVIIPLSAASKIQLKELVIQLFEWLSCHNTDSILDLSYTLSAGRVEQAYRMCILVRDLSSLKICLEQLSDPALYKENSSIDIPGKYYYGYCVEFQSSGSLTSLSNEKLLVFAQNWCSGLDKISLLEEYLEEFECRRISLPTYPFEKNHYWISTNKDTPIAVLSSSSNCEDAESIQSRVENKLVNLFALVSEIPAEKINANFSLEKYGISSILITELNKALEIHVGEGISKALFYQQPTLSLVAESLLTTHKIQLLQWLRPSQETSTEYNLQDYSLHNSAGIRSKLAESLAPSINPIDKSDSIAVIGISCRFPAANTIDEFWDNLSQGRDCITEIPKARWDYHEFESMPTSSAELKIGKWGGFIDDVEMFDPRFFNVIPNAASLIDPQIRLFMQICWASLEDAGYNRESLQRYLENRVGVFVGVCYGEYQLLGSEKSKIAQVSYGSIANRTSYFMDFVGPSLAVDTLCSSSLTALHLAKESILRGECSAAIVGGVNLSLHPSKYRFLSSLTMTSSDGRCRSFGDGGDGYVPGEGVAAAMLKTKSLAIEHGDQIYGLILSSGINAGGHTHGYTVPSPKSQAYLIAQAMKDARVDPSTISYIEAHGTGTPLGDPIEIAGLVEAFQSTGDELCQSLPRQFCAIGSVKSNIGHLEGAAGIAGLTKILLQFKYRKIAPSIHSKILNSNIDFPTTPFYVPQTLVDWDAKPNPEEDGVSSTRTAGLSSFGAGGANAHVILQECVPVCPSRTLLEEEQLPILLVLSAKTQLQVKIQAEQLISHIQRHALLDIDLPDLAYTLQVGREAMNSRLAIKLGSGEASLSNKTQSAGSPNLIIELTNSLTQFILDEKHPKTLCYGSIKENKLELQKYLHHRSSQALIQEWITEGNYSSLLNYWSKGLNVDWELLYSNKIQMKRISLPTYPFMKEPYWIEGDLTGNNDKSILTQEHNGYSFIAVNNQLHPLIHKNTSTIREVSFSSYFNGEEFFLRDHIINHKKYFPGVAHLEMASEAIKLAAGLSVASDNQFVELTDVVWLRPGVVENDHLFLNIRIVSDENSAFSFDIFGKESFENEIVYCRGYGVVCAKMAHKSSVNIEDLRKQFSCRPFLSQELYDNFSSIGLDYGPTHKGITALWTGNDSRDFPQGLVKLDLPDSLHSSSQKYTLNPSLMDSALQACMGLGQKPGKVSAFPEAAMLPFSLDKLKTHKKIPKSAYAWLRYSKDSGINQNIKKLNISIYDDDGAICVELFGFYPRTLNEDSRKNITEDMVLLQPCWEARKSTLDSDVVNRDVFREHHVRFVGSLDVNTAGLLQKKLAQRSISAEMIECSGRDLGDDYLTVTNKIFLCIKKILLLNPTSPVLLQIILLPSERAGNIYLSGLSALLKSARKENPNIHAQIILLMNTMSFDNICSVINRQSLDFNFTEVRYYLENGDKLRRQAKLWQVIEKSESVKSYSLWCDGGIYLITGGLGGLGLIFSEMLAKQANNATVVLVGRSAITPIIEVKLAELAGLGITVDYQQSDVCLYDSVKSLISYINNKYGSLSGVIHAAGTIDDNFIVKKSDKEFDKVLAAKVSGLINLDRATENIQLDYFILFSSVVGTLGNIGQSDYAAANGFMDGYAVYRNELVKNSRRFGHTLSVGWSLWQDGGMQVNSSILAQLKKEGFFSLKTKIGCEALVNGLNSQVDHVLVCSGSRKAILLALKDEMPTASFKVVSEINSSEKADDLTLMIKVQKILALQVSEQFGLPAEGISLDSDFSEYGFDSITFSEFSHQLNKKYKLSLAPTIFFEHRTLKQVSQYLVSEYGELLSSAFDINAEQLTTSLITENLDGPKSFEHRSLDYPIKVKDADVRPEAIAVIGMSGSFPQAPDIDTFWKNLKFEKNCITEIPKDRWDWQLLFGDANIESGKTKMKWGGFLADIDLFDPLFFNISPREAILMDPQQRLMIIHTWNALEDAGYAPTSLAGSDTAVFIGIGPSGYNNLGKNSVTPIEGYSVTGIATSVGPNRISYLLDLHGPSEPIDTACSSALVAIHRSVELLRQHQSTLAIAGGVNLILSPEVHISFSKAGMLSEDGCCKTFSNQANGYVRGEGLGILILKTLEQAESDNDQIYGLILSSAENHGGRANSLTAPNPKAQAELLKAAYQQAAIDPRTVTYIEAHGTGTELGDPVEVNGLKNAFNELYNTQDSVLGNNLSDVRCGLGSVKTNIGHLELSAGVAGVIKVLLQLKHKTLVKSLHSETINPYIDFKGSPFYVVQETQNWDALDDQQGTIIPRRAGVSSFGFGGVNAHVVLEEYCPVASQNIITVNDQQPVLIVLSAKTEAQLIQQAQNLLIYIDSHALTDADLPHMAYTLQVGRDAMSYRAATVVSSLAVLIKNLTMLSKQAVVEKPDSDVAWSRGSVKKEKDTLSLFAADKELQEAITKWIARRKFEKLLELWVKGLAFDWDQLYGEVKPHRISLPTYPFANERYWIESSDTVVDETKMNMGQLHPLVHQNNSNVFESIFTSTFGGDEFFFNDHQVQGTKVLPGVGHLEMARVAIGKAYGINSADGLPQTANGENHQGLETLQLTDVVWLRPLVLDNESLTVYISVTPTSDTEADYDIYSIDANNEETLYSQGRSRVIDSPEPVIIDVAQLKSVCTQPSLTREEIYATFKTMGLQCGPGHQAITELTTGLDDTQRPQVLATLQMPKTPGEFGLHPGLLDSALQASIGLSFAVNSEPSAVSPPLSLPFALSSITITQPLPEKCYAWVRFSEGSQPHDAVQKLDISVCDEHGVVCVDLKGFSARALDSSLMDKSMSTLMTHTAPTVSTNQPVVHYLLPSWDVVAKSTLHQSKATVPNTDNILVLSANDLPNTGLWKNMFPGTVELSGLAALSQDKLTHIISTTINKDTKVDGLLWVLPQNTCDEVDDETLITEQASGVLFGLRLVKTLLSLGYAKQALQLNVITWQTQQVGTEAHYPAHASVHGLIGSLAKELPNWSICLLDLPMDADQTVLTDALGLPSDSSGNAWAYRQGQWYQQYLFPADFPAFDASTSQYRQQGVYVVIGGAGGLGEVWSEHVIREYQAHIVWLGRRELDDAIELKLERLSALGPRPLYLQADATDRGSLTQAHQHILDQFSVIHGVVHSAIVLDDKSIANMDEARFSESLSAKVDTSVRLAQTFKQDNLDFVLFFSSLQSFFKNAGQSNYAAGCTFTDAFAQRLAPTLSCPVKIMNWGYWGDVGIVTDQHYQERMAAMGVGSIEPFEGMVAIQQLLSAPIEQLGVMKVTTPETLNTLNQTTRLQATVLASDTERLESVLAPGNSPLANRLASLKVPIYSKAEQSHSKTFNRLQQQWLWQQLQSLGFNVSKTGWTTTRTILPQYTAWFDETIRVLSDAGYPDTAMGKTVDALWSDWEKEKANFAQAGLSVQAELVASTLRALPDILTGKIPVTDILFPNSSMEKVEGVYKDNPQADYFNAVLAEAVVAIVEAKQSKNSPAKLRLLEIGAGTGGTSEIVFDALKPYQNQVEVYTYSDISKAFLMHAEEHYCDIAPYLDCRLFNVEKGLWKQGIDVSSYDIVIATNVLHATKNMHMTLRNAKAAMKGSGVFLINEFTANTLFNHLTFGLTEGWWLTEDPELRITGCPGLSVENWNTVLRDEGFDCVQWPTVSEKDFGQQVIIAHSNGVIKQPRDTVAKEKCQPFNSLLTTSDVGVPSPADNNDRLISSINPVSRDTKSTDQHIRQRLNGIISEAVSTTLHIQIEEIDCDDSFADYGVDSITGVGLVQIINQALSIELETTSLFSYETVNKLADHIVADHSDSLRVVDVSTSEERPSVLHASVSVTPPVALTINGRRRARGHFRHRQTERLAELAHGLDDPVKRERIAIIGMSGRFAHSANLDELWQHLVAGDDLVEIVSRWDLKQYAAGLHADGYCQHGSFVSNIDQFDPLFFNISGLEATYMDPQQRLFLEAAWGALEDAGYVGKGIEATRCGVYVGGGSGDYTRLIEQSTSEAPAQAFWGNSGSILASRIAYHLDLQGPAVAIDTACSSSLVAIHMACQGLNSKEIEMALAGGVYLQTTPQFYVSSGRAGMLSRTGRCFTFDERADGFVPGEGLGVIVLKRLSDALLTRDHVYGVIRGSGINQDGSSNGITAPNAKSQERLEREVYDRYDINPEHIQYVEAHGTGTILGDPIEFGALTKAFKHYTEKKNYCAIGSIKTNLGHTAMAAGVAGVLKILLALKHKKIPPSLHFQSANAAIDVDNSPFYINTALIDWPLIENRPRLAAVSSFGFSGTNAHIVIEEAPAIEKNQSQQPGYLIVLSARTKSQLKQQSTQLVDHLDLLQDRSLADLSFTLLIGRKHFEYRLALIVSTMSELVTILKKWLGAAGSSSRVKAGHCQGNTRKDDVSLIRFGDQCIHICNAGTTGTQYLENLSTVAELYIQGYVLAYENLFKVGGYSMLSLPTYPFSKERYWVETNATIIDKTKTNMGQLHPLVHQNNSYAFESTFTSTFTGEEFFFNDHQVQGTKVLSGVGHLEMARVAIEKAYGLTEETADGSSLPKYAFANARYWPQKKNSNNLSIYETIQEVNATLNDFGIFNLIHETLQVPLSDIKESDKLSDLGIDSLLMLNLIDKIEKLTEVRIHTTDLGSIESIKDLISYVAGRISENIEKTKYLEFEIIKKGNVDKLPVFWIHGGFGTIQPYIPVAEAMGCDFPFYGIQARGLRSDEPPIGDIVKQAEYYVEIILHYQPEGPYQLGGFSHGGRVAYEICHILQSKHKEIKNLVMLDSAFPFALHITDDLMLPMAFFNFLKMHSITMNEKDFQEVLKRTEDPDEPSLSYNLAEMGTRKGLRYSIEQLENLIIKWCAIMSANLNSSEKYASQIKPLPKPEAFECHYFLRKHQDLAYGPFIGGLIPDSVAQSELSNLNKVFDRDEPNYWRKFLPKLTVYQTESEDHMMLFENKESFNLIVDQCRKIYEES